MLLSLFRSTPSGNQGIFSFHILRGSVQHVNHGLWVVPVNREQELSRLKSVGEGRDQDLIVSFVN